MNSLISKIKSSIKTNEKPRNLKIFEFTKIINPEYLFVGDNVIIDDFCLIYAKKESTIKIGSWVHIGCFSSLTGGKIILGNFVGISGGCRIYAGSENYENGALMNPPIPEKYRDVDRSGCVIKDFSFIGTNSCILPGVTIGEGAIVGAGSVVKKDLDPWGIYIMKNGKMVKIKQRDKNKTIKNAIKLQEEFQNIRLTKFDIN